MKINSVKSVYFSPNGNSRRVAEEIALKIAKNFNIKTETIDFTLPGARENRYVFMHNELVIFALPVYAGRLPNKIAPFLENGFDGGGALCVPVVTFGNRSYDNALIELCTLLEKNNFNNIAAGAFVSEHSFSEKLANSRPNEDDIRQMKNFADKISDKIIKENHPFKNVIVKGDKNYSGYYTPLDEHGQPAKFLKAKPKTNKEKCTACGLCAENCPMGSIDFNDYSVVNAICIKCQACIKICPVNAKYFDDKAFLSHIKMLENNYMKHKANEMFIDPLEAFGI